MESLPVNVRLVIDDPIMDLKSRESISCIGLFGSWSRGDAVVGSDVDLLVVDKRDFDYEYVERAEFDGHFLDLNYVPLTWVLKQLPPEIDQKLYEVQIIYDPNGILAKTKSLMLKLYMKPERVEIRTGNYLIEADTYLSRALSAFNKNDHQSAKINAAVAFEAIMKILIDTNKLPWSNSHFIRSLESSAERFGLQKFYNDYFEVAGFSGLNMLKAESMLNSFFTMWKEVIGFIEANASNVKTLHARVRNNLDYYGKESFLKGMSARTESLIDKSLFLEATHYVFRTSVSLLENYVWLVSMMEKKRFDFTALFQNLKDSTISPEKIYQKTEEAFGVQEVSAQKAEDFLRRTKETILSIRQKRRELVSFVS